MAENDTGVDFKDQPSQPPVDEGMTFENPDFKPLPSDIAKDRAAKADFGLRGKVDKSYDDYYNAFVNGQEPSMRDYIVQQLYAQNEAKRQQSITQMMQMKGDLLSAEDLDRIPYATNNPGSVIEDHYAQRYMDHLNWPIGKEETNWIKEAVNTPSEGVQRGDIWSNEINIGTEYRAKVEFGRSRQQDAHANAEKQSWLGWGIDEAKNLSGIYQVTQAHPSGGAWSLFAGNMREEFIRKLWSLPLDEMQKQYDAYIATQSPSNAKQFANDFVGMTSQEKMLENVFPFVGIEGSVASGIAKKIMMQNQIRTAVRQQVLAGVTKDNPELAASLSAGNIAEATIQRAWGSIIKRARRADPLQDALEDLPYLFRLGRENLSKEMALRPDGLNLAGSQQLLDKYDELIRTFPEMISDLTHAERVPGLAEKYRPAMEAAQQQVIDNNKTLASRIWNLSEPWYNPITKSWFVDAFFGKSSQEPFGSLGHAGRVAKENRLTGHDYVGQAGAGFYIRKSFPVDETAPGMRQYYAKLSTDLTPTGGVLNSFMSRLRTPNETLSDWMTRNREVATFASSRIEKYAFDQAEEIRKLAPNIPFGTNKKAIWDDFERVLNNARFIKDPTTGKNGYTFKTVGELQTQYMKQLSRLPTDPEVAAYFAFKRIQEMDHALRVIDIVSNKYRNGVMSHRMFTVGKDGEQIFSPEFDAVPKSAFPSGHTSDTIAIIGEDGKAKVIKIGELT